MLKIGAAAAVALALGGLAFSQSNWFYDQRTYQALKATEIANGFLRAEEGWSYLARDDRYPGLACEVWLNVATRIDGEWGQNYPDCVRIVGDLPHRGCGWWDRNCLPVQANRMILDEPEVLARSLEALKRPCAFLPHPDEARANPKADKFEHDMLDEAWAGARCETHPERWPGKIVLNIVPYRYGPSEMTIIIPAPE